MRRLTKVRAAGIDMVVRADRNVDLLGKIPVVVAHEKDVAAVLVVVPALVGTRDAAAELPARFAGQLRRGSLGREHASCERRRCEQFCDCQSQPVGVQPLKFQPKIRTDGEADRLAIADVGSGAPAQQDGPQADGGWKTRSGVGR